MLSTKRLDRLEKLCHCERVKQSYFFVIAASEPQSRLSPQVDEFNKLIIETIFLPLPPGFPIACGFGNDKRKSALNASLKQKIQPASAELTLGKNVG